MLVREFHNDDIPAVKRFTDRTIGEGYYSERELADFLSRSRWGQKSSSLVLVDPVTDEVRGLRLTCLPGQWSGGKGQGLNPHLWRTRIEETAYFQSLFIDGSLTGQGWGKRLSLRSLEVLWDLGAKAVVCHSWKESPNDSSGRYLRAMGFEFVASHPLYWHEIDYVCSGCGKPCRCTAEEMIKYLEGNNS